MSDRKVTLNVAGHEIIMNLDPTDEETFRLAAQVVNRRMESHQKNGLSNDPNFLLAYVALESMKVNLTLDKRFDSFKNIVAQKIEETSTHVDSILNERL
jgi:cell division protein ZapA (FtsZ GTPase activity inhibitor)